jgi:hypothetical protein
MIGESASALAGSLDKMVMLCDKRSQPKGDEIGINSLIGSWTNSGGKIFEIR